MLTVSAAVEARVGEAPAVAAAPLEVVVYRPGARDCTAFEARLRRALAEVGRATRLVLAADPLRAPLPPGVYLSPTFPTVVLVHHGRVVAQAVGDLPLWELRTLLRCG